MNTSSQHYRNIYNGYRALVEESIAGHAEGRLEELTKEYFARAGEHLLLISVSKKDESGNWQVLLHSADPNPGVDLPKIKRGYSSSVHVHEGDNYVLLETSKTEKGAYKDGFCITMAIRKPSR